MPEELSKHLKTCTLAPNPRRRRGDLIQGEGPPYKTVLQDQTLGPRQMAKSWLQYYIFLKQKEDSGSLRLPFVTCL